MQGVISQINGEGLLFQAKKHRGRFQRSKITGSRRLVRELEEQLAALKIKIFSPLITDLVKITIEGGKVIHS